MAGDDLTRSLEAALADIPLIDPHSHIDPLRPASKSLDDILGYHYYTELAHSAGMSQAPLAADVPPPPLLHAARNAALADSEPAFRKLRRLSGALPICRTIRSMS